MTELLKAPERVGVVTHYYGRPHVAVIRFSKDVPLGAHIHFVGATTDFEEDIESMEYDHRPVTIAKEDEEIAVNAAERVREGDRVYAEE